MVVALLPMLGLNKGKDQFSGNQEAVLPHNQEAVLPHNPGIRNQEAILDLKAGSNRILGSHRIQESQRVFNNCKDGETA
jgi:hypothetical protein